ncbi:phage integrase central domain-containing protein [Psychrobacter sanguinis]|uniref:phage integrase central domain-containing protein n=1 Tax=Psychrobacter sanguinis TaxID=861445 RepID=UPI00387A7E1A
MNPKDKKKEKIAEQDGSRLFDTIAQAWYADRKTFLAPSTFGRNYSAYTRDVKPIIGQKLIDNITPPDILTIGKNVEARGNITVFKISSISAYAME